MRDVRADVLHDLAALQRFAPTFVDAEDRVLLHGRGPPAFGRCIASPLG